jgi:hypothetical protein
MRSGQRFSYLALDPVDTRALERRLPHQRILRDQSNLIPLDPEAFIQSRRKILELPKCLEFGLLFAIQFEPQSPCRDRFPAPGG